MKRRSRRPIRRGGFTLLEVLLVLAILGVIAAVVVPNLLGQQEKALIDKTKLDIQSLEKSLKLYASQHNGQFPQGNEDAMKTALLTPTDLKGKPMDAYLEKLPRDQWGNAFRYEYPTSKFPTNVKKPALWSFGPNGKDDSGQVDDIANFGEDI